jgi:hypothetical protein
VRLVKVSRKHSGEWEGIITNFAGGLDKSKPPFLIDDSYLYDATNFFYDPKTGYPSCRKGLKKFTTSAAPGAINGIYEMVIGGVSTVLATCADGKLYKLDANPAPVLVGTLSGSDRTSFSTMNAKAVICSGGSLQTYDGTTFATTTSPAWRWIADYNKGVAMSGYARILGCGNSTDRDRFGLSKTLDPTGWTYNNTPETDAKYIDVGYKDGAETIAVMPFKGDVFAFKKAQYANKRAIYRAIVRGDSATWTCLPFSGSQSTLSPHFICEVNDLFFMDKDGPKVLTAVEGFSDYPFAVRPFGQKIAGEIAPFLKADGFSFYDPYMRIMLVKPTINGDTFYAVDPYLDRWTYFRYGKNITAAADCLGKMLLGASDGYIYEYDEALSTDDGVVYPMTLETKWFDFAVTYEQVLKNKYLNVVGITDGSLTMTLKVADSVKYSKQFTFGSAWLDWATVNSILPGDWLESLDKTVSAILRDSDPVTADQFSIQISVTSGRCSIGQLGGRISVTGRE